eukprot:224189_1
MAESKEEDREIDEFADYFDVDDILAEDEMLSCKFLIDALGLGYLDESNDDEDLKAGAVADLPVWLAQKLWFRGMVEVTCPKFFSERFATNLLADPTVVNLSDRSKYFYRFGMKVSGIQRTDNIPVMLQKTLSLRYREIMDKSRRWRGTEFSAFTKRLTAIEKELFDLKYLSAVSYDKWRNNQSILCQSSTLQTVRGKRKRVSAPPSV